MDESSTNLGRVDELKTQLKQILDELEQNKGLGVTNQIDKDVRLKLLSEAKRIQNELVKVLDEEKRRTDEVLAKSNKAKIKRPTALDALPDVIKEERKKQIADVSLVIGFGKKCFYSMVV